MTIDEKKMLHELSILAERNNRIDSELYPKYEVKRGLRYSNGAGVLVGLTKIGDVHGFIMDEGEKVPDEGRLSYRGINVKDIVSTFQNENRFGFEEVCYLLIFGELPNKAQLEEFQQLLAQYRTLPDSFIEDMILKAPSHDIMNKLARSVLGLYSYDDSPDEIDVENILRQCIELIARFPTMVAYGYQAKAHYYEDQSLYIHMPQHELGTAENILHMIRPDNHYTKLEAELLDLALVLHAEHGGGNNSAFTTRVVSSSGTDTYSAIAAAVGSLKGPKHGGASNKVRGMMLNIMENVSDWEDENEIEGYLTEILKKEAYDGSGLIYGIGHAIYTLSDPRAVLLKQKAYELANETGHLKEFNLYASIEKIAPKVFEEVKKSDKKVCANVDFYSGFVYDMLNIPEGLYTPLFAVARIAGWCAHRIEEGVANRIIRPAYKSILRGKNYTPLNER